ncbi:NAD(P)-binding protein [Guyanagaster necrorhizus]|uniref:NAD(P)-binding protein n=1 Tax=Guyanagaster necrorhizus TaxID=856835 RepID=A0A9P7VHI2_9AGAR|nr:NAD(P)-binding protein [Guyanagaster necrorhizus MCA 3950]KAG7441151.1 NAD(P)-binding protein [Guyanagaster necrorhizus MCA 3950]
MPSSSLVWFITGTSSGLGKRFVLSALARGDRVIATARALSKLDGLFPSTNRLRTLELDVTSSYQAIKSVVDQAVAIWGRIDVCVNNAGIGVKSIFEEGGSDIFRQQFETNVFGVIDVTTAVLPAMRTQRSGTIVQIGSRSSWVPERVPVSPYSASKAAVRVFSETLATEVAPLGIRVLIVEPAALVTEHILSQPLYIDNLISDYDHTRHHAIGFFEGGWCTGDADLAVDVVVDVVRGDGKAKGREWPTYLVLGPGGDVAIRSKCEKMVKVLDEWKDVTGVLS